jgi:hypothetical protein
MSDWQQNIMDAMGKKMERKANGPAPYRGAFRHELMPLHIHCAREFVGLIEKAARLRDVNRSSYIRRSIAVLLAHDLNMPITDVLYHSPAIGPHGRHQWRRGERDQGEGINQWCPHPGCDGHHL